MKFHICYDEAREKQRENPIITPYYHIANKLTCLIVNKILLFGTRSPILGHSSHLVDSVKLFAK